MKVLMTVLTAVSLLFSAQASKASDTSDAIAIGLIAGAIGYAVSHDRRDDHRGRGHRGHRPQQPECNPIARYPDPRCNNNDHGYGHGNYGGYSSGRLSNSQLYCRGNYYSNLCSSQISWYLNSNNYYEVGAVTVSVPTSSNYNEQRERLFACGKSGSQRADWIYAGHTYIFKMYAARDCREGAYYGRPLDTLTVRAY